MKKALQLTAVSLTLTGGFMFTSTATASAAPADEHLTFGTCQKLSDDPSSNAPGNNANDFGPGNIKITATDIIVRGAIKNDKFVAVRSCN
ncbi:MAG: hypothetical protein JWO41_127 [Candidatus Saccharibacteria bacterium]|nr:hypothetical protein [Candidatus Saccharibacteria bacterium]